MNSRNKVWARAALLLLLTMIGLSSPAQAQNTTNLLVAAPLDGDTTVPAVVIQEQPALSFWLDRVPFLEQPLFGIPLWHYAASLIYIVLAFLAAMVFNQLLRSQLRRIADPTADPLNDLLLRLVQGPVRVLTFVLILQLGLHLFTWPVWLERWLRKGLYLVVAFSLTYLCLRLVDLAVGYWQAKRPARSDSERTFHKLLLPLITKSLKAFLALLAVLVTLDNLGFNITTLLAGVSIGGLALGLAAQDTVGNLFGAAAVFIDRPFKIGDRVQVNGVDGVVEEMGLRSTRVRNPDGHLITVPNKTMGNSTITNVTMRPNIKTVMNIGITYDTPADRVAEAGRLLKEIYGGHPMTHDVIVGFNQFADSSLNFLVIHWWKGLDYKQYLAGIEELNLTVKRRFDAEGISFAFPSRTVYLRQEGDWRLNGVTPAPQVPDRLDTAG